jgi:hypothetical protein
VLEICLENQTVFAAGPPPSREWSRLLNQRSRHCLGVRRGNADVIFGCAGPLSRAKVLPGFLLSREAFVSFRLLHFPVRRDLGRRAVRNAAGNVAPLLAKLQNQMVEQVVRFTGPFVSAFQHINEDIAINSQKS